jgi:hypothetical protein
VRQRLTRAQCEGWPRALVSKLMGLGGGRDVVGLSSVSWLW